MKKQLLSGNAKMADLVFTEFAKKLMEQIPWLNIALGAVKEIEEKGKAKPVLYTKRNEYVSVLPDENRLGNYCFFDVNKNYEFVSWHKSRAPIVKVKFGLLFWFDMSSFMTPNVYSIDRVVAYLSKVLWNYVNLTLGEYQIDTVNSDALYIFRKYYPVLKEKNILLYPYGAVRFDGLLTFSEAINEND